MKKLIFKSAIIISLVFTSSFSLLLLSIPTVQAQIKEPYKFQVEIPGLAKEMSIGEVDGDVIKSSLLKNYIVGVYNYSFAIAGVLAAVVLMGGGVLWLISGGSPGKIGQAKKIIGNSLIGLVLLFGSNLILRTINPELLAMKDLETIRIDRKEKASISGQKTNCCFCTITHKYSEKDDVEEYFCQSLPDLSPRDCEKFCQSTQRALPKDDGSTISKYQFTSNMECSKDKPPACIPNTTTVDVKLTDGVHANNFDTKGWGFQDNIINQVGDMSDELVNLLNCMRKELPKGVGQISSISDENNAGKPSNCNKKNCIPLKDDDEKGCAHVCGSCHYGAGRANSLSLAVDLGDEWNTDAMVAAAKKCSKDNNWGKPGIKEYSTHVHISAGACTGDGDLKKYTW